MSCSRASARPALRIAISKAARGRTAGRTWSAQSWPPQRRLPDILWTCASGTWTQLNKAVQVFSLPSIVRSFCRWRSGTTFTTEDTERTEKSMGDQGRFWRCDAASFEAHWISTALRSRERRYRSDGAEAISQASNQAGIRPRAVLRLAVPPGRKAQFGFRSELAAI